MNEAEKYAHWVLSPENSFKTGRLIKLAAQRFLNDLKREDIYFDEKEAMVMVEFGEKHCYQWEGEWRGKPVVFEPWQKFAFMQLFGWIRRDNGRRRFNRFFLQISKKNGKSTMCAILSLFHLFADSRIQTPKVFTAANNEDQAKICVNMAGRIIQQSPAMMEYVDDGEVKLMTYGINITEVIHREKDGFIKALSKEGDDRNAKTSGGKHGINASCGLVDEIGMAPSWGASGSIESSMASRLEWLMAFLTTAGFNKQGPCYTQLRALAIKVLEGLLEMDNYLPLIYELDNPVDETGKMLPITIQYLLDNPHIWPQSNPNIGVSVNPDFLKSQLQKAKISGGTDEVEVMTLNFNQWMDSPEVFISADTWNKNTHGFHVEDLKGQECFGGIELADGMGLSAFVLYFPGEVNKILALLWMPAQGAEVTSGFDGYSKWVQDGFIKTEEGNVVDNNTVIEWIMEFIGDYAMHSFCAPIKLKNHSVVQGLFNHGFQVTTLSQAVNGIGTPTAEWEKLFIGSKIEHFGNPVLAWANSNCMIVRKEAGMRIEKNQKVLPIYACINALAEQMTMAGQTMGEMKFTELG